MFAFLSMQKLMTSNTDAKYTNVNANTLREISHDYNCHCKRCYFEPF